MRNLVVGCILLISACIVVKTNYTKVPPGPWRGVFYLDGRQTSQVKPDEVAANFNLKDVARGELPVNIEFSYAADSSLRVELINGEERIAVDNIEFERDMRTARDTITIHFPLNDTYITGYHESGVIEGYYVDETRTNYEIPFAAFFGQDHRFSQLRKTPTTDMTGRWEASFSIEDSTQATPAVAEFTQRGNDLEGTFLTPTGDYRYLEGTIQEDRFYLSTFDGSHVFLFSGKVQADGSLLGLFRSGTHYRTIWSATRNAGATLPSDSSESREVLGQRAEMSALLPSGESIALSDLPGRLKVVTLMGSWCPNCKDEAIFLDSLRRTLPAGDVSFLGLAYERFTDSTKAMRAITRFGENLDLGFPVALAGYAGPDQRPSLPGVLEPIPSYPTLLVLDAQDRVLAVHTGFTGPATSAYGSFTEAFAKTLQEQLAQ